MKGRFVDAAAFAIGLVPAYLVGGAADEFPWLLRQVCTVLSPGYFIGFPVASLVATLGMASIGFYFLVAILANGLLYALLSFLIRKALRGDGFARLAMGLGLGAWLTWGAVYTAQAWPRAEKLAPVALGSPLAGRWEGVLHAPRGDRHVTLVCHPRADSSLGGYLYVHGEDMGPFEEGAYTRDSFSFAIVGCEYTARFRGRTMRMASFISGLADSTELRFVSADTSRPAPAALEHESPLLGRWDGVLHTRSRDLDIKLVFQPRSDGTLRVHFYTDGHEEMGRTWDESWSGDSLAFRLERIPYRAHFDNTAMTLQWVIADSLRSMVLRRVSSDTASLARPPQPNRWVTLPARGK